MSNSFFHHSLSLLSLRMQHCRQATTSLVSLIVLPPPKNRPKYRDKNSRIYTVRPHKTLYILGYSN
ncbi:unnamed protein product [Ixodes persulcatus]